MLTRFWRKKGFSCQSAFCTQSAVCCILYLVCILYPVCSLQSAFCTDRFNKSQRNYSTIERECLALVLAQQHFEVYVSSCSLPILYSDHNSIAFIHKMNDKNQRLLSLSVMLQEYALEIRHIKGNNNVIADSLSESVINVVLWRTYVNVTFLEISRMTSHAMFAPECSTVLLKNNLEHSMEWCNNDVMLHKKWS